MIFIIILPSSHYHISNITKEENKNKNHTLIQKSDEDSFDSPLNIEVHLNCHIFKLKNCQIIYVYFCSFIAK